MAEIDDDRGKPRIRDLSTTQRYLHLDRQSVTGAGELLSKHLWSQSALSAGGLALGGTAMAVGGRTESQTVVRIGHRR